MVRGPNARDRAPSMYFEFARMDVYQAALDFVVVADQIAEALPSGRAYLRDQLRRGANSIAANIAEGVGEHQGTVRGARPCRRKPRQVGDRPRT